MTAPSEVLDLVERFDRHREAYRSGRYNETQLRREFLDPLFKALGWDMDNEKGYAEAYKDVVHEDAVKVGGLTKAPDYAFRIGGVRKFFVRSQEALGRHQGRPPPRVPAPPIRLVGQAAALDPHRFRGTRGIRLPGEARPP